MGFGTVDDSSDLVIGMGNDGGGSGGNGGNAEAQIGTSAHDNVKAQGATSPAQTGNNGFGPGQHGGGFAASNPGGANNASCKGVALN